MTVETKTWSALLMEAVERNFEEVWKEKYGENYPEFFDVRISFVPIVSNVRKDGKYEKDENFQTFTFTSLLNYKNCEEQDEMNKLKD